MCRICGSFLKSEAEAGLKSNYTSSFGDHAAFRSLLLSSLFVVVAAAGLLYYYGHWSGPREKATAISSVELPQESWYRKSWWSYARGVPSVSQILAKNDEVSGKMLPPEIARTLALSGTISVGLDDCIGMNCNYTPVNPNQFKSQSGPTPGKVWADPKDQYQGKTFREFGRIEVASKIPDKSMRKAVASTPGGTYEKAEILEVFDGSAGAKRTNYVDRFGKVAKTEVEKMDPAKAAATKAELESMWKRNFADNTGQEVRGIELMNEKTVFAVTSKNKEGYPETHYFDSVTGFLVKMELKDFTIYLDDYRQFEQAKVPYTLYFRRLEGDGKFLWMRFDITEWKIGEYIDDSVFAVPAA